MNRRYLNEIDKEIVASNGNKMKESRKRRGNTPTSSDEEDYVPSKTRGVIYT